jgi:hypothetical protein
MIAKQLKLPVVILLALACLAGAPSAWAQCCCVEQCYYGSYNACVDACNRARRTQGMTDAQYECCVNTDCAPCSAGEVGDPQNQTTGDGSPILIDLGEKGLLLTGIGAGVSFDIDNDGAPDRISWTGSSAADAFLALDRNGNGRIDSGGELFGNYTRQPPSASPNGFSALAVYDGAAQGGNDDGIISPLDAVWTRLILWTDSSHDGVSQSAELRPLAGTDVTAILLDYKEAQRRDRYGNRYLYRSSALTDDGKRKIDVFDVFFVRE